MKQLEENKKNIFLIICLTILTLTIFVFYKITYPFVLAFILAYLLGPINHRLSSFMPNAISSFVALLIFTSLLPPVSIGKFLRFIEDIFERPLSCSKVYSPNTI